ncbi:Snurportin-1 [Eumeta japonica]|uniref:Snurportin-1 n=1 Tax=Eumeta variegata TaxID=151549 RepID=A0A4C1SHA8_EUMVA|nr:Snurportin-1 [Eumeta japonica]
MDEVVEKFNSTLGNIVDEDEQKQNFKGMYKNWGRLGHQEDRRKQLLEVQRNDRNKKIDNFRGIMELVDAIENRNDKTYYRPSIYVAGFNKVSHSYRNVLMLSEWLIEKPEDFHENWYVVPCPKGTRMLVVANRSEGHDQRDSVSPSRILAAVPTNEQLEPLSS